MTVRYITCSAWLQTVGSCNSPCPCCRLVWQRGSTGYGHNLPNVNALRATLSTTRPWAARLQAWSSSWASGTVERMKPAKLDTLAYTPGLFFWAHPSPKLTTPAWIHVPFPMEQTRGPPESPWERKHLQFNTHTSARAECWCTLCVC